MTHFMKLLRFLVMSATQNQQPNLPGLCKSLSVGDVHLLSALSLNTGQK